MEYLIKVYQIKCTDNSISWCAECKNINGLVGGGNTQVEAVCEMFDNLPFHLEAMGKGSQA